MSDLSGLVTGFAVTDTMSARDALAPLGLAYHFDAVESEGVIKFVDARPARGHRVGETDLVHARGDPPGFGFSLTRAQETDLPHGLAHRLYRRRCRLPPGAWRKPRRLVGASDRVAQSSLPLVLDQGQAIGIGARLLQDAWVMRETAHFALPPSQLALDPADEVVLTAGGRTRRLRLTEIDDAGARADRGGGDRSVDL